jgi:hypothetical protein
MADLFKVSTSSYTGRWPKPEKVLLVIANKPAVRQILVRRLF